MHVCVCEFAQTVKINIKQIILGLSFPIKLVNCQVLNCDRYILFSVFFFCSSMVSFLFNLFICSFSLIHLCLSFLFCCLFYLILLLFFLCKDYPRDSRK